MKINAQLNGETHTIEIEGGKAAIDGREYEIEASTPETGVVLLKSEGRIFEAVVTPDGTSRESVSVSLGGNTFDIRLSDPKRLRASGGDAAHADGLAEIKSAMPGKVVRILVEQGSEVAKGEGVVVVEAMKMQNELKAPKDGTVSAVKVEEGQTVNAGDVLVTIE
jgi:biotin carboxyl carrier protein